MQSWVVGSLGEEHWIQSGSVVLDAQLATSDSLGMEATLEYAADHFEQLVRAVESGEEVLLHKGTKPVARMVPVQNVIGARPQVGDITSAPVIWNEESFAAIDETGMKELGLL